VELRDDDSGPHESQTSWDTDREPDPPDVLVERREFAQALRECARRLQPRSRLIWFFRVFYGMSSKQIAVHPEIALQAAHVDVLLQRVRHAVRECMHANGFEPRDMPPGTFTELWKEFHLDRIVAVDRMTC
jgi:DNA-directed RNA polymerase specialized sigma24 family protein